jgi:ABC-type thiamine transport system ATPase subunit
LELDIKDGIGAGIRAAISFALQLWFITSKGAYPILFLDETFSSVSDAYRGRFFTFMSDLSKAKGFSTIFITHTTEALDYADKVYYINAGVITERKNGV